MLNHNYITELLKSKDIIFHQVVENEKEVELHISQTQKPHKCPKCGSITSKIHDYRVQRVKNVPIMGKRTYLIETDKFHFTRYVYWALENVRKRVQKELEDNLRKYFKRSRKLLLKSYEELTAEQREELEVMFWYSEDLRKAHRLKEEFRKVLESSNSAEAKVELKKWIEAAERSSLSEFCRCIKVFMNWFSEIVNSFDVPYTNSVTEGFNNKIKVLKRNAYGYRNFERFRKRILYSCGS